MAPSVELSPNTFTRLQAHAVPLVDTIESVINRILDSFEKKGGTPLSDGPMGDNSEIRRFNPNTPPSLTHTKPLEIMFDGQTFAHNETSWNSLLYAAARKAKSAARSAAELKQLVVVNYVDGRKDNEGYRFLSDVGFSIQGQDANGAWKAVSHIAQKLNCPLRIKFIWRDKDGAAFPGVTGQFVMGSPR